MTITDAEIAILRKTRKTVESAHGPDATVAQLHFAMQMFLALPRLLDELERLRAKEHARLSGIAYEQAPYITGSEADE